LSIQNHRLLQIALITPSHPSRHRRQSGRTYFNHFPVMSAVNSDVIVAIVQDAISCTIRDDSERPRPQNLRRLAIDRLSLQRRDLRANHPLRQRLAPSTGMRTRVDRDRIFRSFRNGTSPAEAHADRVDGLPTRLPWIVNAYAAHFLVRREFPTAFSWHPRRRRRFLKESVNNAGRPHHLKRAGPRLCRNFDRFVFPTKRSPERRPHTNRATCSETPSIPTSTPESSWALPSICNAGSDHPR